MSRTSLLTKAWASLAPKCGEHTLAPISAGTLQLLLESNNALFTGGDTTETAAQSALLEFVWIHTAPENDLIAAFDDHSLIRTGARRLALTVSITDLQDFGQQFEKLNAILDAGNFELIPDKNQKPGKPETPEPSLIGSPPTSEPSEATSPSPESMKSCGSSPLPEDCNISTPPMPKTTSERVGKSRIWEQEPEPEETPENVIPLP